MKNIPNCKKILFEIKNDEHNQGEQRYCVENADGQRMFLRVSPKEAYEGKKIEHEMMEQVYNLGVLTSKPIDFGFFDNENGEESVYSLISWIDGEDMEKIITSLTEAEQYAIGLKCGADLRLINSIPALDKTAEDWETDVNAEIDWKFQEYRKLNNHFIHEECIFDYIEKNRHLLKNRPQCFLHYDYNLRNILLVNKSEPYIIDFGDHDFGDAWREFTFTKWTVEYPHFLTGMLNGYFNHSIPEAFFPTLLLYACSHSLQYFIFDGFTEASIKTVTDFVKYHDYMSNPMPAWYLSHYAE
jgi:serine/threonine-protein kinase